MVAWCEAKRLERGATMTLDQCWEVARRWYAGRLEPTWRGRTPEAAQVIFAKAGLTDDFWRMI